MNEAEKKTQEQQEILDQERRELEDAFQKVFSGPEAEVVLAYLYKHCHGGTSTFDPNPFVAAHNEGRRVILIDVLKLSDVEESDMRRINRSRRLERERRLGESTT